MPNPLLKRARRNTFQKVYISTRVTRTLACIALAFALGDRLLVDKPPSIDEVRPKVVIRRQEFYVIQHYPKGRGLW